MGYLIVNWVLSSFGLFILANTSPGFRVNEISSALIAAGAVGLCSASIAAAFKHAHGGAALAISGALLLLADTFLFRLSALVVPGFAMLGFLPAIAGALLLAALNGAMLRVVRSRHTALQSETSVVGS